MRKTTLPSATLIAHVVYMKSIIFRIQGTSLKTSSKKNPRTAIGIFSLGVGIIIICYYLFLLYGLNVEFQEFSGLEESASIAKIFYSYFTYVIYLAGLPPLILVTYFLIICRAPKSNLWGLLIVGISIYPVHIFAFASSGGTVVETTIVQSIPLLLALFLIFYWMKKGVEEKFKKNWKAPAKGSRSPLGYITLNHPLRTTPEKTVTLQLHYSCRQVYVSHSAVHYTDRVRGRWSQSLDWQKSRGRSRAGLAL